MVPNSVPIILQNSLQSLGRPAFPNAPEAARLSQFVRLLRYKPGFHGLSGAHENDRLKNAIPNLLRRNIIMKRSYNFS
jgi:hypothetical protein